MEVLLVKTYLLTNVLSCHVYFEGFTSQSRSPLNNIRGSIQLNEKPSLLYRRLFSTPIIRYDRMNPLFMQFSGRRLELLCLLFIPLLASAPPSPAAPLNRRQSPDNKVVINSADSYWYAIGLIVPSLYLY